MVLEPRSLSTPLSQHPDTPAPTAVASLKAPTGSEMAASNDALLAACRAQRAVTTEEHGQENGSSERNTARGDGSRRVPNAPGVRPMDPVFARVGHLRKIFRAGCLPQSCVTPRQHVHQHEIEAMATYQAHGGRPVSWDHGFMRESMRACRDARARPSARTTTKIVGEGPSCSRKGQVRMCSYIGGGSNLICGVGA